MYSNGYSTAFLSQPVPSYAAYSQFTGHGLQSSHDSGVSSTKRARDKYTPSSDRGRSTSPCGSTRRMFGDEGINMDTREASQQEQFSLIQTLQAHLEQEIQQYLQSGATLESVADLWSGQTSTNRLLTDEIQQYLTFCRSEGWNDRGRPSHDGSRIIRHGINGHTEVVRPFMILELEDVSSWKPWYKDAEQHRVDGPNGTAFTGMTIVPTTGFRYHVYGVFDMTQTRKIDCDNRFRVKIGQPTDAGIALICKLRAQVNAAYQTSLENSNDPIRQRTDGGLFAEPPFEPTERNVKLWHAALDAKDVKYESYKRDSRPYSKAPVLEKRSESGSSVVDVLPSLNRKRRAECELEPGEIEQEAVSGAEEHVAGNCARGSSNKRPKLSDHQDQQGFKIKGNATRGTGNYTTERPVSSQCQAFRSDRPTDATKQRTDPEQATGRGERTKSMFPPREKPDRHNATQPDETKHRRRDASVTGRAADQRAVAPEVRAVIASGEDARRRRGSNR